MIYKYVGKSTETKPTNVPEGSEFFEVDTKKAFMFYDGDWWPMN